MNSDEIRKRVRGIVALQKENDGLESDILKLAEDILGKPLEPEFDESLVKHGSVWSTGSSTVILLECDDKLIGSYVDQGGLLSEDCFNDLPAVVGARLINDGYKYIGQFDFSYPQKHPLFDEAVELLKTLDTCEHHAWDKIKAFLAKLGGK